MRYSKIDTIFNALLLRLKMAELEPKEKALEILEFLISVIKLTYSKTTSELVAEIREIAIKMGPNFKNGKLNSHFYQYQSSRLKTLSGVFLALSEVTRPKKRAAETLFSTKILSNSKEMQPLDRRVRKKHH